MKLSEYAKEIGISANLAKQWKARGKILVTEDGYRLKNGVTVPSVTAVTGEKVTEEVTVLPDLVTVCESCVTKDAEAGALKHQVAHWQTRFDQQQAENDSLKLSLAYAQNEVLSLRSQFTGTGVGATAIQFSVPVGDELERARYGWGEFVDKCCTLGQKITGEPSNRRGVELILRAKLKIQPDAMMSVPVSAIESFRAYVEEKYYQAA